MSTTIDQKVVEMRFDNSHFEKNVSTTMSSLDKLKQSLSFKGASKELENFAYTTDVTLRDIRYKFRSLFEYHIANQMKNWVVNIGKALTITPISSGFNEYELKMGSIQTIMAGTGESLETVNQKLNELNEYSDKTIYSFQDMTSNIGKFTNAGVNLEDSVAAIKGVSNVAAISGANANEASRAMYNFAQALSSGYVKLIDWKSIENANMATVEFKNQLIEAAAAEGKLTKTSDGMYKTLKGTTISATKNFNDSLQEQWMTSEVLIKTLKKYSDETTEIGKKATQAATEVKTITQLYDTLKESAQSGWAQTWEIIVGDFEEAKVFLKELNEIIGGFIGRSADARNELLENWKVLGGRTALIDGLRNSFEAVMSVITPISEAFKEIFGSVTSESLLAATEAFRDFAASLKLSDKAAENLKRTCKGIFAVLDLVAYIFVEVFKAVGSLFGATTDLGGGLLGVTAIIGDMLVAFVNFIKETEIIPKTLNIIVAGIRFILKLVTSLINVFTGVFSSTPLEAFYAMLNDIQGALVSIGKSSYSFGEGLKETFENTIAVIASSKLIQALKVIWNTAKQLLTQVFKVIGGIINGIGQAFAAGDLQGGVELLMTLFEGGFLAAFLKVLYDTFAQPMKIVKSVKQFFEGLSDALQGFTNSLNAEAIKDVAVGIAILVGAIVILCMLDKEKMADAVAVVALLAATLAGVMKLMSSIKTTVVDGEKGMKGWASKAQRTVGMIAMLIGMAIAVAILASAVAKLAQFDWNELARGLVGVAGLMLVMTGVVAAMSKFQVVSKEITNTSFGKDKVKFANTAKDMIVIALALLIMSVPFKTIGEMDWASWGRGLIGIVVLMGAMTGIMAAVNKLSDISNPKAMTKFAGSMLILSIAINAMIPVLLILGLMPTNSLIQGVLGLVGVLVALAGVFTAMKYLAGSGGDMVKGAASIAILASAIKMVLPFILILGLIPTGQLIQGVLGLVGVLTALTGVQVALKYLGSSGGNMVKGAASIAILVGCINLLIPPLLILSMMDLGGLIQSVVTITVVLAALAGTLILLSGAGKWNTSGLIQCALSMLILSGAIATLATSLVMLSLLGLPGLIISLGALAGAFIILGLAAKLVGPTGAAVMIAMASAIALVSASMVGMSAAVVLLGVGLSAVAAGIVALGGAFTILGATLGIVCQGISQLVTALIVGILKGLAEGFIKICELVAKALPALSKVVVALIYAICDIIIECVPKIVETLLTIVVELFAALVKYLPIIAEYIIDIVVKLFKILNNRIGEVIAVAVEFLFKVVTETIKALAGMDATGLADALSNMTMITLIVAELAAMSALIPFAMIGAIGLMGLMVELSAVLAVIGAIGSIPGLIGLIDTAGEIMAAIGRAVGGFIGSIAGATAAAISSFLPQVGEDLSRFMTSAQPFIDGIKAVDMSVFTGTKTLVSSILLLTASSLLDSLTKFITFGQSSISTFGEDIAIFGQAIVDYGAIVSQMDASTVEKINLSVEATKGLVALARTMPHSGGLFGLIAGNNDIGDFGKQLVPFGEGIMAYSKSVTGLNAEAITNSVQAAKGLVEIAEALPNSGGWLAAIAGDNTMDSFGSQLEGFGQGIKGFANSVAGVKDDGSIDTAVKVAKSLVELSDNIPNEGGVVGWFTGENSISKFGGELARLGMGIRDFALSVVGIDNAAVIAAAEAGKSIANMTNTIPNEGGVVGWFTGENSISKFAGEIPLLGQGIKGFADATAGITPESVSAAAAAAESLAEMTNTIPRENGIKSWFAGDLAIGKFGNELISVGKGIKGFATETAGITPDTVSAAAGAARSLADMTNAIPKEEGIKSWFAGDLAIGKFGTELVGLGKGIKGFATETSGIDPAAVTAAANAGKTIAEMTNIIPKEEGIKSWFAGDLALGKFAKELPGLGEGIKGFATETTGITADTVTAAAEAGKTIAEMTKVIPTEGGIKAWFAGDTNIADFADKLPGLGKGLKGFSTEVAGIVPENVTAAAGAAKDLGQMTDVIPKNTDKVASFGENLKKFGTSLKEYFNNTKDITAESTSTTKKAVDIIKDIAEISAANIKDVASAIKDFTKAVKNMAKDIKSDLKDAGKKAIESFIKGINDKLSSAETACEDVLEASVEAINNGSESFESAGANLVNGFVNGIKINTYVAKEAASAMAAAAAEAAKAELQEHSPSRVGYEIGDYFGIAFVNGIADNVSAAYNVSAEAASSAKQGLRDAITKVSDFINNDIDSQPTIRPVLDLSAVRTGAGLINGLLGDDASVGVLANVGSINAMMNKRNQNGVNDDVVSAIGDLGKRMDKLEQPTYNINGINVTGDVAVEEAFDTIIRAARIDRRG